MDDDQETKRSRGRPTNAEVFGEAADDPLGRVMARIRADLIRRGLVAPVIRITIGDNGAAIRRTKPTPGTVRISPTRRVVTAPKAAPERHMAKPKKDGQQKPPHLRTTREVVHHDWSTRETVAMRSSPKKNLRRWGCQEGDHIDRFIADYEMCGSDLRSRGFDVGSGGGGGGTPFPVVKVDAARRLRDLRLYLGSGEYDLVVAVLIHGVTPTSLHAAGGEEHVVARREIRDALERMAGFYTPGRVMRKRTWEAAAKIIQEAEREASK